MENLIITKAIVLRATPFQDSDKILTLFSLELGKLSASLKGCTKPKAKLKFAGQAFCFAEFSLLKKGENYLVITATEIESFFDITKDYEKLSLSMAVLEICDKTLNLNEPNPKMFLSVLKTLKLMISDANPKISLSKFLLDTFKFNGYELTFDKCKTCGTGLNHDFFLNVETGALVCEMCRTTDCMQISFSVFSLLKILNNTDYEKLNSFNAHNTKINEVLVILNANFTGKFHTILKSLKNL